MSTTAARPSRPPPGARSATSSAGADAPPALRSRDPRRPATPPPRCIVACSGFSAAHVADGGDRSCAASLSAALECLLVRAAHPVSQRAVRAARRSHRAAAPVTRFLSFTIGWLLDPRRQDGVAGDGDPHHPGGGRRSRTSSSGMAGSWARSSRSTSRAICATSCTRTCSGCRSATSAHEGRPDHRPDSRRHRPDQGADHAAGHLRDPEHRRSSSLHRRSCSRSRGG